MLTGAFFGIMVGRQDAARGSSGSSAPPVFGGAARRSCTRSSRSTCAPTRSSRARPSTSSRWASRRSRSGRSTATTARPTRRRSRTSHREHPGAAQLLEAINWVLQKIPGVARSRRASATSSTSEPDDVARARAGRRRLVLPVQDDLGPAPAGRRRAPARRGHRRHLGLPLALRRRDRVGRARRASAARTSRSASSTRSRTR